MPVGVVHTVWSDAAAKPWSDDVLANQTFHQLGELGRVRRNELCAVINGCIANAARCETTTDSASFVENNYFSNSRKSMSSGEASHACTDHHHSRRSHLRDRDWSPQDPASPEPNRCRSSR